MLIIAILLLVFIFLFLYLDCQKPKGYPPGPRWWPILGCMLEIARIHREKKYIQKTYFKLVNKYGPILGLKIGVNRIVMLNDMQSARAMLLNEDCDGRPIGIIADARTCGVRQGIIATDGPLWTEQRRFVVRHLREFGFSRTDMPAIIENETLKLLEHLQMLLQKDDLDKSELKAEKVKRMSESREGIIKMTHIFQTNLLNIIWRTVFGKRLESGDSRFERMYQIFTNLGEGHVFGTLFSHFPILRFILPEMSGYKAFVGVHRELWNLIKEELQYSKKTLNPNATRGFMDVYLIALISGNFGDSFNESQLIATCMDLFIAGIDTTSNTLAFAFLFLIVCPRVQKKAQDEIDRVVGRDRLPTLTDKLKMPYVQAIVLESLRMFIGRSMGVTHRTLRDTTILEYKIPKDTMVVVNGGAYFDDQLFDNPKNFQPERFLDSDGNVVAAEKYSFFGLGKRHCIGEMLGRNTIFIIISSLLQKFNFSVVPGEPLPTTEEYIDGPVTASPKPFRALVSLRA